MKRENQDKLRAKKVGKAGKFSNNKKENFTKKAGIGRKNCNKSYDKRNLELKNQQKVKISGKATKSMQ